MPAPFNEVMKQARAESLYPHHKDFSKAAGLSEGGYTKWESGERLPSAQALEAVLRKKLLPDNWIPKLQAAWVATKAKQAGVPAPSGSADLPKVLNHLERELLVILRKYAPESTPNHKHITKTFKKRAGIVLRTALET